MRSYQDKMLRYMNEQNFSQENNETVAMLVEQKIPLGIGLSFHANVSFPFTKSTWSLIIVWKTICKTKSNTATASKISL